LGTANKPNKKNVLVWVMIEERRERGRADESLVGLGGLRCGDLERDGAEDGGVSEGDDAGCIGGADGSWMCKKAVSLVSFQGIKRASASGAH
jgi:hypothetical protein